MYKLKFTLNVKPRTKKTHNQMITLKTGRTLMLPSKQYKEFEKEVCDEIKELSKTMFISPIDFAINLQCIFYRDRDYKGDLTGYLQAIQDALVKAEVLEDDNCKIVSTVNGSRIELDRQNPRIEVTITSK